MDYTGAQHAKKKCYQTSTYEMLSDINIRNVIRHQHTKCYQTSTYEMLSDINIHYAKKLPARNTFVVW